jgi:competence protein ComFC
MKIDPRQVTGPWDAGFTLDVHTTSAEFLGYDLDGRAQFDTVRSEIGEALYQLKYRGDRSSSIVLAAVAGKFIRSRGLAIEVVVPVPPSKVRPFQPLIAVARHLARELQAECDVRSLRKVKETPELKSIEEMAEREVALRDAFEVRGDSLADRHVLLLDDLYRSGASMREAARTLRSQGRIASLTVMALTRTRSRS